MWLGTKREYVHLFSSCTYTTYVGLCERDTNVERYSVWVCDWPNSGLLGRWVRGLTWKYGRLDKQVVGSAT